MGHVIWSSCFWGTLQLGHRVNRGTGYWSTTIGAQHQWGTGPLGAPNKRSTNHTALGSGNFSSLLPIHTVLEFKQFHPQELNCYPLVINVLMLVVMSWVLKTCVDYFPKVWLSTDTSPLGDSFTFYQPRWSGFTSSSPPPGDTYKI